MLQQGGTLSYQEFCFHIKQFVKIADLNNDFWQIHGSEDVEGSMYMVKKAHTYEKHDPTLCLRGVAPHQQHGGRDRADTVRNLIKSYVNLLNEREGPKPMRVASLEQIRMKTSQSQMTALERRHSIGALDVVGEDEPCLENSSLQMHPKWCVCHANSGVKSNVKTASKVALWSQSDILDGSLGASTYCDAYERVAPQSCRRDTGFSVIQNSSSDSVESFNCVNDNLRKPLGALNKVTYSFHEALGSTSGYNGKIDSGNYSNSMDEEESFFSVISSEGKYYSNPESDSSAQQSEESSDASSPVFDDSPSTEDPAEATLKMKSKEQNFFWEFHVIYNASYSVPVLFFLVWDKEGKMIPMMKLWDMVDVTFQGRLQEDKWSILTQQEHPILRRPFFYLHPCGTEDLLKIVRPSWNPVVSWLMTVGPSLGLNICPLYAQAPNTKQN